jgi:hypothetical protein
LPVLRSCGNHTLFTRAESCGFVRLEPYQAKIAKCVGYSVDTWVITTATVVEKEHSERLGSIRAANSDIGPLDLNLLLNARHYGPALNCGPSRAETLTFNECATTRQNISRIRRSFVPSGVFRRFSIMRMLWRRSACDNDSQI